MGIAISSKKNPFFTKKILIPISILLLYLILWHINNPLQTGDFIYFNRVAHDENIWDFLINRYNNWSSRLLIEFVLVSILKLPLFIFSIIDISVWIGIALIIKYLFLAKQNFKLFYLLIALIIIYPMIDMNTAGYVATVTNYSWPMFAMFVSLIPIKYYLENKKLGIGNYFIFILSSLYACNSEQCCLILFLVYIYISILMLKNKKFSKLNIIIFIITICSLIFILTTPGNHIRQVSEIKTWLPEFAYLNLFQKGLLALIHFSYFYLINSKMLILITILCFLLLIFSIQQNKIIYSVIDIFYYIFYILIYIYKFPLFIDENIIINNIININILTIFQVLLSIILILGLILIFYLSLPEEMKFFNKIMYLLIPICGICSRLIMGFSPTVFASSTRPSIFLYFSIIIMIVIIYRKINIKNKHIQKIIDISSLTAISIYMSIIFLLLTLTTLK